MPCKIITVTKKNDPNIDAICENYLKQIFPKTEIINIKHNKYRDNVDQMKSFEASLILAKLSNDSYNIAMDNRGKLISSEEFAEIIDQKESNITFIIGGAFGLADSIFNKVDISLSLSKMTFPHQIAKLVLIEQIFRAGKIIQNHPYHK